MTKAGEATLAAFGTMGIIVAIAAVTGRAGFGAAVLPAMAAGGIFGWGHYRHLNGRKAYPAAVLAGLGITLAAMLLGLALIYSAPAGVSWIPWLALMTFAVALVAVAVARRRTD